MPKRVTDALLRRSRPEKPADVGDSLCRGLVVRLMPSGRHAYRLRPRIDGRQISVKLGNYPDMGIAEARDKAREELELLISGHHPEQTGESSDTLTVAGLYEAWMEKHVRAKLAPNTATRYSGSWQRHLLPRLGDVEADQLERSQVRDVVYDLATETPVEANRTLAALNAAFSWARKMELVAGNPASELPRPHRETPREDLLSTDEIRLAWQVWSRDGSAAARVMKMVLLSGCRIGSLLAAHKKDVQMRSSGGGRRWLVIPGEHMKAGRPHAVPLTEALLEVLGTPGKQGFFFSSPRRRGPITGYSSAMRRFKLATGIDKLGPHVLRTTFATRLAQLGVTEHVIAALLAHQPHTVTGRHYQLYRYDKERVEALELWSTEVKQLTSETG